MRPRPERPLARPAYQGSNPISDIWAGQALEIMSANLMTVLNEPENLEAPGQMMLAAAGNLDHEQFIEQIQDGFWRLDGQTARANKAPSHQRPEDQPVWSLNSPYTPENALD